MPSAFLRALSGEVRGLHEAAYLLGFFALLTQLLALVRDRIFASYFGAGETLDIYYAAFKIPDLLFVCIASLLSVYVLIPFVSERMQNKEELRRFMGSMLSALSLLLLAGSVVIFFATPWLVTKLYKGFSAEALDATILLTRILLLQAFLLGVSNLFSSVTQTFRRFAIVAITPLLYNVGIIIGALMLYPVFGIAGLAWGAVAGALLHFLLQIPFLLKEGLMPRFALPRPGEFRAVLSVSVPRTIALSANHVALVIYAAMASLLSAGSLAVFTLAHNLQNAPITIIGLSYSVAAFPTLAAFFNEGKREAFVDEVIAAARHIIFWTLPLIALIVVLRAHIVRVILGAGAFDWTDTRLTAAALALFALSLTAHALILLLVRAYYAAGNTRTPLLATLLAVPAGVAFAYLALQYFVTHEEFRATFEALFRVSGLPGTEALMLPLGYSLGVLLHAFILSLLYQRDFGGFFRSTKGVFFRGGLAALGGGAVAYMTLNATDALFDSETFMGIFLQGAVAGIAGILAIVVLLRLLRSPELFETWHSLHSKFWKSKTIIPAEDAELHNR